MSRSFFAEIDGARARWQCIQLAFLPEDREARSHDVGIVEPVACGDC